MFGAPEFDMDIQDDKIKAIYVLRGAPCGATWDAAKRMAGLTVEEALKRIGLDTQSFALQILRTGIPYTRKARFILLERFTIRPL